MRLRTPIVAGSVVLGMVVLGSAVVFDRDALQDAVDEGDGPATGGVFSILTAHVAAALGFKRAPPEEVHPVVIRAPRNEHLLVEVPGFGSPAIAQGHNRAHAFHYNTRVYRRPAADPVAVGFVRRGVALDTAARVYGPGCRQGAWHSLPGGSGVICSRDGFIVSAKSHAPSIRQRPPALNRALPYDYAKARDGVLRYYRLPSQREQAQLAGWSPEAGQPDHEIVERKLDGVFLLALDRLEGGGAYYRTIRGRYVYKGDLDLKPEPAMRGELVDEHVRLPLAFVYGEQDAQLHRQGVAGDTHIGIAKPHARFSAARVAQWDGRAMVERSDGVAVARERVRLASKVARPDRVPAGDKWIHIDLDEQTLVAYEGDQPVFVTLVSTGKGEGFLTPTGLYQIREKHISTTMNGPDPDAGYYEVEEVPWTMYYQDSFAIHGAYWHDTFGNTRSHGCTNVSPIDARWLFFWSDDAIPKGWNAVRQRKGTWVYLTRA